MERSIRGLSEISLDWNINEIGISIIVGVGLAILLKQWIFKECKIKHFVFYYCSSLVVSFLHFYYYWKLGVDLDVISFLKEGIIVDDVIRASYLSQLDFLLWFPSIGNNDSVQLLIDHTYTLMDFGACNLIKVHYLMNKVGLGWSGSLIFFHLMGFIGFMLLAQRVPWQKTMLYYSPLVFMASLWSFAMLKGSIVLLSLGLISCKSRFSIVLGLITLGLVRPYLVPLVLLYIIVERNLWKVALWKVAFGSIILYLIGGTILRYDPLLLKTFEFQTVAPGDFHAFTIPIEGYWSRAGHLFYAPIWGALAPFSFDTLKSSVFSLLNVVGLFLAFMKVRSSVRVNHASLGWLLFLVLLLYGSSVTNGMTLLRYKSPFILFAIALLMRSNIKEKSNL